MTLRVKFVISFVLASIVAGAIFLILRPSFWDYVEGQSIVNLYQGKDLSDLSPGQKYALFDAYYLKKDIVNTLRVANELQNEARQLPKEARIAVAGTVGKILRADQRYDFEFMFYDKFLKAEDPEYYHLFRGDSYRIQGNPDLAREELMKARELAKNPEVLTIIDTELKKVS